MSDKQEKNVLVGLKNSQKFVVQKSRPFLDIIRIGLPIESLKLFDTYLGKIDISDDKCDTVVFEKKEYENMLGIVRLNKDNLRKYLENLMCPITIECKENGKTKMVVFPLFQLAIAEQDEAVNSPWKITLKCHELAKKYIFNVDKIGYGYLKYDFQDIVRLNSKYSYILFLYLKDSIPNKLCKKTWTIAYADLKCRLGCDTQRYTRFGYFKTDILEPCKKEIEEKTAIRFTYEPVKNGRSVVAIKFTAIDTKRLKEAKNKTEKIIDIKPGEISQAEPVKALPAAPAEVNEEKDWDKIYGSSRLAELAEECDYEFTKAEMMLISTLLSKIYIPKSELDKNTNRYGRKDYLREKYLYLCAEAERKKKNGYDIMDRFAYLRAMLESDAEDNPKR